VSAGKRSRAASPSSVTHPSIGLLSLLVFLGGCSKPVPEKPITPAPLPAPVIAPAPPPPAPIPVSWVDSVRGSLSLRDKAAQMVWPTELGDFVNSESSRWQRLRNSIEKEKVGGFTMSVGSPLEIAQKLNAMQRMSAVPLLIGADLEFGAGYRARGGIFAGIDLGGAVVFPPEMALGAARDTMLAYEQGRLTAREGRALGIHIAYAPILDVNNNPANPVINTRSYGEDPQLAGAMGSAFIRGVQDNGMIATGKHFPGHGDTGINSHLALPVIEVSRARLDTVELVPFRAAISAGVGAIMSFHGAMPVLDSSGAPGTLSRAVLTTLLREEMGFGGLIISDAMDMRGVLDKYGAVEATKRAVGAGADILIQPLDVTQTIDAIVEGVSEGRYTEARLDSSVNRILSWKQRLGLQRGAVVNIDSARRIVGDSIHAASARVAAERSITLVRDNFGQVPLKPKPKSKRGMRVLSITVARRSDLAAGGTFNAELRRVYPGLRAEFVDSDDPAGKYELLMRTADSVDTIIIGSYVSHKWDVATANAPPAFVKFVDKLTARKKRPIVVALGNPYLLQQIPKVPAYLVAWGGFPVSQGAAARALLGMIEISGRLPISIPPVVPRGAGLDRSTAATTP
jgi:beta-N-acetylhexosaminidase